MLNTPKEKKSFKKSLNTFNMINDKSHSVLKHMPIGYVCKHGLFGPSVAARVMYCKQGLFGPCVDASVDNMWL